MTAVEGLRCYYSRARDGLMFSVAMKCFSVPSPTWKVMVEQNHGAASGGTVETQCQPPLDSHVDSASGKNRLGSRCSLSYTLLTNRKREEEGTQKAYDQKGLPSDSLGGPSRHIRGAFFRSLNPFTATPPCPFCCDVWWKEG